MNDNISDRKKGRSFLLFAMAIALGCLWTYSTAFHAFDDDEFQHTNVAWLMHRGERPYADFFEHHLVLYHGMAAPLFRLGEGRAMIFVFRAISLLAAAGTLFLLYKSGRRLGASQRGAGAGIWLLGLTPMFLLKMTEARPEVPAMLAFAGAVWVLTGVPAASAGSGGRRMPWKPVSVGLLAALMALLSQKYAVVAVALLVAVIFLHGRRHAGWAGIAFLVALAGYAAWMVAMGVARDAYELTVLLNLRWLHSFSAAGYGAELFLSAGALVVTGVLGIFMAGDASKRRHRAALAVLLAGSIALIAIIPVPYRQSFLPLLAVLGVGSMLFCTSLLQAVGAGPGAGSPVLATVAVLLLPGAASLRALPGHLAAGNHGDLERMAALDEFAPEGPVFDGRALMFWRPHVGYHAFMHEEILLMIEHDELLEGVDEYAGDVIRGLYDAGLPPLIRDYRVKDMPVKIQIFIEEYYMPTGIEDVYGAGVRRERLRPGRETGIEIPVDGHWRLRWQGGGLSVNSRDVASGETLFLSAGEHVFQASGLVYNIRIERDYAPQ